MSSMLSPLVPLSKDSYLSDFENIRKQHLHKQIDFMMNQVTKHLETKFNLVSDSGKFEFAKDDLNFQNLLKRFSR